MPDLGLDTLSDDQLVELARAIAKEVSRRNPAVGDAATAALREEIERSRQSQDALWTRRKWLALMARDFAGDGWYLNVWHAAGRDETRVYFETSGKDRRGRESLKYCLYATGNDRQAPGTLTVEAGSSADKLDGRMVRIVCEQAMEVFPDGVKIDCDKAAGTRYDVPPMPPAYTAMQEKIVAEAAAKRARNEYESKITAVERAKVDQVKAAYMAEHGIDDPALVPLEFLKPHYASRNEAIKAAMSEYDARSGEPK